MSNLTEEQKTSIKFAYENAQSLADPYGDWQHDLAAVVETGSMIAWQLTQAFPFLDEGGSIAPKTHSEKMQDNLEPIEVDEDE